MERLGEGVYEVDGTPTDCVNIAITQIYTSGSPDLVVSGINKGYNLGDDVTYSGTVAGALEGSAARDPEHRGVARAEPRRVRLRTGRGGRRDALREVVLAHGLPPRTFLNINVPSGAAAAACA